MPVSTPRIASPQPASERCAFVGLGETTSGRVALQSLLADQSDRDGMTYVFIPGLAAEQEALIAELLSTSPHGRQQKSNSAANVHETLWRRERQQAAVAELGQAALAGAELQGLFDKAVRLVSEQLNTEMCKVLELLPGGDEVLLLAGVGWKAGLVGNATVGTGLDSQAGYTLEHGGAVIVEDFRTETRFNGPQLLVDHGVVSGLSVVIGPPRRPWGVMGAHTSRRVDFNGDDVHFMQAVANVLWGAIARRNAEEARFASEERHRMLMEALPVLIAYCDADCVYEYCNAAYEEWFGIKRSQIIGQRLDVVIGADAYAKVEPFVRRVLAGESIDVEQELPYKYGPPRYVHVTYMPHRNDAQQVVGYYAMVEDISDRRRFEQRLLDANNRLTAVVETAADGIVTIDSAGTIETVNRAVSDMFGYQAEELIGENIQVLMPPPFHDEHNGYLDRYLQTGEARVIGIGREVVGRRKDGTTFPVDLAVSEFTLENQRRFTGILRDISESQRNETILQQQAAQLNLITNSVPAVIAYIDRELRYQFTNAAFAEWHDRPWDEVQGLGVQDVVCDEHYQLVRPMIDKVLAGEPQQFEHELMRPGFGVRDVQVHFIPHVENNGEVLGYILVMTDVTESYHSVAERAMLDASDRERRRIGQDLHDSLGQELTGLSLMAQNVVGELRDAGLAAANTAEQLTQGLRRALQRVRQMSRGLVPIDEVDRHGLIAALENLAGQTSQAGSVACVFTCDTINAAPHAEAATHLFRIAQEAVSNAVKHAAADRIEVELLEDDAGIRLSIRDNGCGLTDKWRKATGMGLRIMRYRANRVGGSLAIHTQPSQGTEVVCRAAFDEEGQQIHPPETTAPQQRAANGSQMTPTPAQ